MNAHKEPALSIVLLTYNDQELLAGCLASLYENKYSINFETIVINNGSAATLSGLKNKFSDIRWIENKKNLGFAKSVNLGIPAARAKYILLLNSDTVLLPDSILPLIRFMDEHKKAGAVGGLILSPDGIVQPTCRRFPMYLSGLFGRTSLLKRLFPNNRFSKRYLLSNWNHKNIRKVDWVCGAYMLFRKEALIDVGYLDESYFMYCEEIDWCYQAKKKGWKVYYVPQARLIHSHRCDTYAPKKIIRHHKSMYRFYCKHLRPAFGLQTLMAVGVSLKIAGLILLYLVRAAFTNLHKTLKLSNKLSTKSDWHR